MTDKYFLIGKITAPHGIKGEVKILPTTDEPSRFALLEMIEIFAADATGAANTSDFEESQSYIIEGVRFHKNQPVLKLRGVNDRNTAETLRGAEIKIPPEQALPLDDDEYYRRDLIGMTVIDERSGAELGTLVQVLETGANDVYVVQKLQNGQTGQNSKIQEILIPAIKQCIIEVSVSDARMTVRLMKGMR